MKFTTLLDLIKQSRQGQDDTKVLRYEDGYTITHNNDLITKGYIAGIEKLVKELIPPPANTLNGLGLTLYNNSTTFFNGYLASDPSGVYKSTEPAGSLISRIVSDGTFSVDTMNPEIAFQYGDKGTLELLVNGVVKDTYNLSTNFNTALMDGNQTYTPATSSAGKITVLSVGKFGTYSKNQKATARLNLVPSDLSRGYNNIQLRHTGMDVPDQLSASFEIFFDASTNIPSVGIVNLSIDSNNFPKYLSGVKFLGLNDSLKTSYTAQYVFANTYVASPTTLSGLSGANNIDIAVTDTAVIGVSTPPHINNVFTVSNKILPLSVANKCTENAILTITPKDPFGSYTPVSSASNNILVSTFSNRSTNTQEYFDDEVYRLPLTWNLNDKSSVLTNNWNSRTLLENGNAQQFIVVNDDHGLMYPEKNFSIYLPSQSANYTSFTGDQKYLRAFISPGSKSNIQFILEGVTSGIGSIGSGDINIQIKLPSQSGLLDCAKPYDSSAGVATDGNGCLQGSISYTSGIAYVNVTFGGKVTFDSNNILYVLITLRNKNQSIRRLGTNW